MLLYSYSNPPFAYIGVKRNGQYGRLLAHNLTNAIELRRQLENEGAIFHGSSDTEVICYLITRNRLRMGSIETAISKTMDVLEGAYSLVIMSATKLIAVRDPRGYRPLCIGTLPGGGYVFASESCALDAAGAAAMCAYALELAWCSGAVRRNVPLAQQRDALQSWAGDVLDAGELLDINDRALYGGSGVTAEQRETAEEDMTAALELFRRKCGFWKRLYQRWIRCLY